MSDISTARPAGSLLTTEGRAGRSFRYRLTAGIVTVASLHVVGVALVLAGLQTGAAAVLTVTAGFAYVRGLVHSFDFDHIAMIDNSTRKFVAEGRNPTSVGLAFSLGHSTVVIITSLLVIAGAGVVREALDESSGVARVLGIIGLSVSGLYLTLVAVANLATFRQAWRLRRRVTADPATPVPPDALVPRGPAAMIMTAPLRRIRHPRHVYVIGFLFSLGFDTSSQIGLLVLTASAVLAGAPLLTLLALPVLFTAAMTLGDTLNGLMMLKMYESAQRDPVRKINYNLLITGVSIVSALLVGTLAICTLLSEQVGVGTGPVAAIAGLDTSFAGYLLAGLFATIGVVSLLMWRRAGVAGRAG